MKNVQKLTNSYGGFFKELSQFSYSPYSMTFNKIYDYYVPHSASIADVIGGGFRALVTTFILTPVLLPLTLVTTLISLTLAAIAFLSVPLAYPIAATIDCIDDSKRLAMR